MIGTKRISTKRCWAFEIVEVVLGMALLQLGCAEEKKPPEAPARPLADKTEHTAALQSSNSLGDFAVYSSELSILRDRVTSIDGFIGSAGQVQIGNDSVVTGDIESVGPVTINTAPP